MLAALKRVPIQDETELEDFMVEIDILTECKHRNIVDLYQAFFHDSALWVRLLCVRMYLHAVAQFPCFQFSGMFMFTLKSVLKKMHYLIYLCSPAFLA